MPDRSGPIQRIYGEFPPGQPKRGRCRTVRWPAHRKPAWTTPFRGDLAMSALDCFDYAVSPNGSFSVVGSAGIGRPNAAPPAAAIHRLDRPAPRVRVPGRTAAAAGVGLRRRGAGGLAAVPAAVCDLRRVAGPYAGLCGRAG